MNAPIESMFPKLREALSRHAVERAYLFGSYAKGTATANSDIDLLIRFRKGLDYMAYTTHYFDLLKELRLMLDRDVDLMAEETLQNPYLRQSIDEHKILLL